MKRLRIEKSLVSAARPDYNVTPDREIISISNEDEKQLIPCIWEFLPTWAKDPAVGQRMINARAER